MKQLLVKANVIATPIASAQLTTELSVLDLPLPAAVEASAGVHVEVAVGFVFEAPRVPISEFDAEHLVIQVLLDIGCGWR